MNPTNKLLNEETLEKLRNALWESIVTGKLPMVKKILDNFPFFLTESLTPVLHLDAYRVNHAQIGTKPLHQAILSGRDEVTKLLVESYKADANVQDSNGRTPLHLAASCGNVNVINLLVSKGADVNKVTIGGETAVMKACMFGEENAMNELLFTHKCDLFIKNNQGKDFLEFVKMYFGFNKAERLIQDLQVANPNLNLSLNQSLSQRNSLSQRSSLEPKESPNMQNEIEEMKIEVNEGEIVDKEIERDNEPHMLFNMSVKKQNLMWIESADGMKVPQEQPAKPKGNTVQGNMNSKQFVQPPYTLEMLNRMNKK